VFVLAKLDQQFYWRGFKILNFLNSDAEISVVMVYVILAHRSSSGHTLK
jgi:hypothetical protein